MMMDNEKNDNNIEGFLNTENLPAKPTFRLYMEIRHRGLFPYSHIPEATLIDIERATIPIAPEYEGKLASRIEALATKIGSPDFLDYVKELIMKDLFEENPHSIGLNMDWDKGKSTRGKHKTTKLSEEQLHELIKSPEYIGVPYSSMKELGEAVKRDPDSKYDSSFEKIIPALGKLNLQDKVKLVDAAISYNWGHEEALQELAVPILLQVSTELALSGHYDTGIQLIKKAMDYRLVWWDTRQSVLVDHLGKLYFANGDFIRAEMCFEEVARRERMAHNAKPYNFHLGIIEIANKHYERGNNFLLLASEGFESSNAAKRYNEAVDELYRRISERKKDIPMLLP